MHYQRLLLDDFGVFQRAELHELQPGLTVIAGEQRAGKTTFMEAVRRLGYGISQGEALPPPADTYQLTGELVHEEQAYRVSLEGYGDPQLTSLTQSDGGTSSQSPAELFEPLSKQQYRQLYTLSLDQLQRLPPTIEEPEDLARVLLGAAYGSLADLPEIKAEFADQAYDIGRTTGHPRYGKFSDAYETIEAAQTDLDTANEQVARYDAKRGALDEVLGEIEALDAERSELNQEQRRLTVIQQYFDDYHTYRRLGSAIEGVDRDRREAFPDNGLDRATTLQEEFQAAQSAVTDAATEFRAETVADDPDVQRDRLLAVRQNLEHYRSETAGWRERLKAIRERGEQLEDERSEIEGRIAQCNDDWTGSFDEVRSISTDLAGQDAVDDAVAAVTEVQADVADYEADRRQTQERLATVTDQLEAARESAGGREGLLIAAGSGAVGVIAAIGVASAVGPVAGAVVGGVLVLVGTALAYRRSGDGSGGGSQRAQLTAQRHTLEQELAELETQLEAARSELSEATDRLDTVRSELAVDETLSPAGVADYYAAVVELRSDIEAFEANQAAYQKTRDALETELESVAETVSQVHAFEWEPDAGLDQAERLFAAIETAATEAELAVAWAEARSARTDVIESVVELVEEWESAPVAPASLGATRPSDVEAALDATVAEGERLAEAADQRREREAIAQDIRARFRVDAVQEAFAALHDSAMDATVDEWHLEAFEACADQFASVTEVDRRLDAIEARKDEIEAERGELQETQADLRQELEALASEDDLLDARQRIQQGSREIERLGDAYGTYRLAEYITERVQDRLIAETTGPLLDEASDIFARITAEYDGIEHTGELAELDFEVLRDGAAVLESGELSRATAEQLFLAVRLARIRQLDTALPVVLDDALTNFDPAHSARTLGFLDELARTHQVFFLTAHPAFVELAAAHADVSQYWQLADGRFDGPFTGPESAVAGLDAPSPGR